MAQSGHPLVHRTCPLSGVKHTGRDFCSHGPIKSGTFCKVSSQQARLGRLWEDPKRAFPIRPSRKFSATPTEAHTYFWDGAIVFSDLITSCVSQFTHFLLEPTHSEWKGICTAGGPHATNTKNKNCVGPRCPRWHLRRCGDCTDQDRRDGFNGDPSSSSQGTKPWSSSQGTK